MAIIAIDREPAPVLRAINAEGLWQHYLTAGFLYPDKLRRLEPVLPAIHAGLPRLLAAPPDVFQLHAARVDGRLVASASVFRDCDGTYVPHHAVSQSHPASMVGCLRSIALTLGANPDAQFMVFYARPENRWPTRLARDITARHPAHLTTQMIRDYMIAYPQLVRNVAAGSGRPDPASVGVEILSDVAVAGLGTLQAWALGLTPGALSMPTTRDQFAAAGLSRERVVVPAVRDGALAGFGLVFVSSVPMNFSFLCSRIELVIHPQTPDRPGVVRELARKALEAAACAGVPICPLLVEPQDAPAAATAGFAPTGRQYQTTVWGREGTEGWPSVLRGTEDLYKRAVRRAGRPARDSMAA